MLTLNDGRKELYQWDTGRMATVDIECDVVHFSNLKYGESLAVEVKGGKVAIPNKLLMSGESIYCWAFVKDESGAYTKNEQDFAVMKRAKPSDYLYTETEVISVKNAVNQGLEEAKESGKFKGEKGDTGATGPMGPAGKDGANGKDGVDGKDGTSVTVSSVSESTEDCGNNVVTFSDGKTLTVKNGTTGRQGEKGDPTDVQQTTGQSTTAVMSQKASTDEINALKDDLTDKLPKSPVNWEPWTAEERVAARERIGIGGDWEYIDEIILSEDAGLDITLNRDYKKIYMFAEKPPGTSYTGETRLFAHDKNNSQWTEKKGAFLQESFADDCTQILAECCGKISFMTKINSNWTYNYGASPKCAVNTGSADYVINHIYTYACTLPAGLNIKIWGVPA